MNKKFYIYIYLDPRKPGKFQYKGLDQCFLFEPFYVGKGIRHRWKTHYSYVKKYGIVEKNIPFYCKLKKLINLNIIPFILKIKINLENQEAYDLEHEYIKEIGTLFDKKYIGPLTNMNLGGSGGQCPSEEVRKKISKRNKGKCIGSKNGNYGKGKKGKANHYYGKKHSKKIKDKMRRSYLILHENNVFEIVKNLQLFCKQHNFNLENCSGYANKKHYYKNKKIIKLNKDYSQEELFLKKEYLKSINLNHVRSYYYKLISPDNKIYIMYSSYSHVCKSLNLSSHALYKNINNVISEPLSPKAFFDKRRMNTIGWCLQKLQSPIKKTYKQFLEEERKRYKSNNFETLV